jgi:hypothetical protein
MNAQQSGMFHKSLCHLPVRHGIVRETRLIFCSPLLTFPVPQWVPGLEEGVGDERRCEFFKIKPAGVLTSLHSFVNTNGAGPTGLVQAADGNLYGTARAGGANGEGAPLCSCRRGPVTPAPPKTAKLCADPSVITPANTARSGTKARQP